MEPTSSPTSSERSDWSRSTVGLAAYLAMAAALIALAFWFAEQAETIANETDPLFDWEFAIGSVLGNVVILGLTFAIAAAFPSVRQALGLQSFALRWVWIALALTLASLVVSAILEPFLHAGEEQGLAPSEWNSDRAAVFAVNGLLISLWVPFVEELFFRGLGVRALGFLGPGVAIVGSAAIFALAHGILVGIPALGFFGLVLGYVRYHSRSVWPGMIAHATYNGIGILVAFGFAVSEEEARAALAGLL